MPTCGLDWEPVDSEGVCCAAALLLADRTVQVVTNSRFPAGCLMDDTLVTQPELLYNRLDDNHLISLWVASTVWTYCYRKARGGTSHERCVVTTLCLS